jgi:NTE family protein
MSVPNVPNPTATAHGIAKFAPLPERERTGIGLCLSGGGYRAALFHLGVLRRFNELGILAQATTISSVSGGSIISAYLATKIAWPLVGPVPNWEDSVSAPFRNFTSTNIRTGALLKSLLPWERAVNALAAQYEASITRLKLAGLPPKPTFIFCATDLGFGVNWTFEKDRMGDYQAGYITPTPPTWPLSLAVAASSCFPPVFNPLPVRLKPAQFSPGKFPLGPKRDSILAAIRLSDGGVYDNLGLEPVWQSHKVVLSSDGGALFAPEADRNIFGWVKRYVSIPENQSLALRKRWLISNFLSGTLTGTYCGIGGLATNYGNPAAIGYGKDLVENFIAKIRTDLDSFSDAEAAILENHGYCLADAAAHRHVPKLISSDALPFSLPHPNWMNEDAARKALENSWRRTLAGRGWV